MVELPELTTSANLPPVPRSALGRGIKGAPGPEAAPAGNVGERPLANLSLWAALENEVLLKRVTSALQPATLRETSATAIAFNGEDEPINSTAENIPDYDSLVHGSHERHSLGLAGKQNLKRPISSLICCSGKATKLLVRKAVTPNIGASDLVVKVREGVHADDQRPEH
jgi:hypothetical protein